MNKTKQNSSQICIVRDKNYEILKTSAHEYMVELFQREKDIFAGVYISIVLCHLV